MSTQSTGAVAPATDGIELLTHPDRQGPPKWTGAASIVTFLVLWELIGQLGLINKLLFSWPSKIVMAAQGLIADGTLVKDITASGSEFSLGFGMAAITGVILGVIFGWYPWADAITRPFVNGLNTTPRLALLPLLILWLGLGYYSKVAVIFLGAVFPILLNTQSAMRTLDTELVKAARSFEATDWQIFRTIALPASIPPLITGLRLGVGRALIGVVVAEMYAADAGLGFLINMSGVTFQTDRLFVGLMLITAFGITANWALIALERRFDAWRPEHS